MAEIKVRVFPGVNKSKIYQDKNVWRVYLKSKPQKQAANKELKKIIARYFKTKANNVIILSGQSSPYKKIRIKNENL